MLSALMTETPLLKGRVARVGHYILEGVTDALFLDFETSTIEYRTRTMQM